MKKLTEFLPVVEALARVSAANTIEHDNGTFNQKFLCHYLAFEEVYDKQREVLKRERLQAAVSGSKVLMEAASASLAALPPAKRNLIFKLMEPIEKLSGSKVVKNKAGRLYKPAMRVEFFYVSEDMVNMDVAEWKETKQKAVDRRGNETPVIQLVLVNSMLDVKEPLVDKYTGKIVRESRTSITAISYRSMQLMAKFIDFGNRADDLMIGMEEI